MQRMNISGNRNVQWVNRLYTTRMCLAIPGRILSVNDCLPEIRTARVDFGGVVRPVCIQWVDAVPGDYILVHAGMAIAVIDPDEAAETLRLLEKMAEEPATTNNPDKKS